MKKISRVHFDTGNYLRELIRKELRAKGWTQKTLAQSLGVSHVTIRRWLTGSTTSTDRLLLMARQVGIDLTELKPAKADLPLYSPQQEKLFVDDPNAYRLFCKYLRGLSVSEAQTFCRFSRPQALRLTRALEAAGLIELLPDETVRYCLPGPAAVRPDGQFAKTYRPKAAELLLKYFSQHYHRLVTTREQKAPPSRAVEFLLNDQQVQLLHQDLEHLISKYRTLSLSGINSPQRKGSATRIRNISMLLMVDDFDLWEAVGLELHGLES